MPIHQVAKSPSHQLHVRRRSRHSRRSRPRRPRLPRVPSREVRPARRPERRRRRPRRLRLHRRLAPHQHPDQLPVPPDLRGGARRPRPGLEHDRPRRRGPRAAGAGRHARLRERSGTSRAPAISSSPTSPRRASASSSRRADAAAWATRSFATSTNRAPRKVQPGEEGESQRSAARAEAARRRRPRRLPERRQVDADRAHFGGATQDCRLPVHHADAESRRRQPQRATAASSSPTCRG